MLQSVDKAEEIDFLSESYWTFPINKRLRSPAAISILRLPGGYAIVSALKPQKGPHTHVLAC
jgi:hypothetical protein